MFRVGYEIRRHGVSIAASQSSFWFMHIQPKGLIALSSDTIWARQQKSQNVSYRRCHSMHIVVKTDGVGCSGCGHAMTISPVEVFARRQRCCEGAIEQNASCSQCGHLNVIHRCLRHETTVEGCSGCDHVMTMPLAEVLVRRQRCCEGIIEQNASCSQCGHLNVIYRCLRHGTTVHGAKYESRTGN